MRSDDYQFTFPQRLPTPMGKTNTIATLCSPSDLDLRLPLDTLRTELKNRLAVVGDRSKTTPVSGSTASAILVPIIIDSYSDRLRDITLLFTKRSHFVSTHKGEISFPGGKLTPPESYLQAAKRETFEEIGILPTDIVGSLGRGTTSSGAMHFEAFVGFITTPKHATLSQEVDRLIISDIATLTKEDRYHMEKWDFGSGLHYDMHFFEFSEDILWGATARVTAQLIKLLVGIFNELSPGGKSQDSLGTTFT